MPKIITFNSEARETLREGAHKLYRSVVSTLGPNGRNVVIQSERGPILTKDGVTVAKHIDLKDPIENVGAQMVKQAAIKTAENAGDGTTTSTLLAYHLIEQGLKLMKAGSNAVQVKRGMEQAVENVVGSLKLHSEDISGFDQIKQVASISANNDEEIGNLIATAMDRVGREGVITVEESKTGETTLEIVEGMQFDRGYKSPYFVTDNNTMNAVLDNPVILVCNDKITQIKELLPTLESCSQQNKPLLIIADDIDGEALATMILNKIKGILRVVAVRAPEFGDRKLMALEDIAALTGATVVSREKGFPLNAVKPEHLGTARTVVVGKDNTTLVDGGGNEDTLLTRVNEIKAQIEKAESPYAKEKLQERLARLAGGVAIINVGANSELEMREKKDRVDDALHATQCAVNEGIVPGGGVALFRLSKTLNSLELNDIDRNLGVRIVRNALQYPLFTIVGNSGISDDLNEVVQTIRDNNEFWYGINVKTGNLENFKENGIIDPTKVTRLALQNAVSVAGAFLTTECVIVEEPEEKQDAGVSPYSEMM
jgi:chaperonin GroEL